MSRLPIIDIAPYLAPAPARDPAQCQAASDALHRACLEHGFFYLDLSQYVDLADADDLTRLARAFFALPQDDKDKISIEHQDRARGYQRLKQNVTNGLADSHEAIDLYKPVQNPDKSKPLWGENQWPDVAGFQHKYEAWIEKMKTLGLIVMEAMSVGLGMAADEWRELRAQVDDSFWVMRIIGYPPLSNDDDGFSCGAHKDYGCLTFLYADSTRGALQVLSRHSGAPDGVWIDADPVPNCVVCNIGEMWEIWTNGLYKSTLHRVVHRGSHYRVSIPFFFEPNLTALVAPLAAALRILAARGDEEGQACPSVVYGDFLLRKVGSNFALG